MGSDVKAILEELVNQEGIEGVEVIQKDGQCLHELFRQELDIPTYSLDSATLAATSEMLLPRMRLGQGRPVVSNLDDKQVVLVRANAEVLLAALAAADRPSSDLVGMLERAATQVDHAMNGGGPLGAPKG